MPVIARRAFVLTAVLAVTAAVVWLALLFGTRVVGLEAAESHGTSMEPVLHQGDALVLGGTDPATLHVGDVVWALHEGWPILHRVIDIHTDARGERIVVTKGDNLPDPDPPVNAADVQGKLVLKVPALGTVARAVGVGDGYKLLALLVQGFAAASILFGLVSLQGARRSADAEPRTTSPSGLFED
jgi:signal peptidase I